jgi:hypothetical protein
VRTLLLTIVLSLVFDGCERLQSGTASTQTSEQRAADDGPMQPADAVSPEDLAVLDAALSHMAADPKFELAFRTGQRLIVHSSTLGGSAYVRHSQVRGDSREGNLPEDALRDLERRNNGPLVRVSGMTFSSRRRAGAALGPWSPTGPNVTLDDLDQFPRRTPLSSEFEKALKKAHPDAKAYVRVALPGYSTDRRQAVVRLAFGPSAHGAMATYLLVKDDAGAWTVTWRKFCYYA